MTTNLEIVAQEEPIKDDESRSAMDGIEYESDGERHAQQDGERRQSERVKECCRHYFRDVSRCVGHLPCCRYGTIEFAAVALVAAPCLTAASQITIESLQVL